MAVHQGVDFLSGLTDGTVVGGIAFVALQIRRIEDRADGTAVAFVDGGKDRGNTRNPAAVILHRFHGRPGGISRSHGGAEDQNVFTLDHGNDIVPEEQLAARGILGRDHVNGLMGVQIGVPTCRKGFSKVQ